MGPSRGGRRTNVLELMGGGGGDAGGSSSSLGEESSSSGPPPMLGGGGGGGGAAAAAAAAAPPVGRLAPRWGAKVAASARRRPTTRARRATFSRRPTRSRCCRHGHRVVRLPVRRARGRAYDSAAIKPLRRSLRRAHDLYGMLLANAAHILEHCEAAEGELHGGASKGLLSFAEMRAVCVETMGLDASHEANVAAFLCALLAPEGVATVSMAEDVSEQPDVDYRALIGRIRLPAAGAMPCTRCIHLLALLYRIDATCSGYIVADFEAACRVLSPLRTEAKACADPRAAPALGEAGVPVERPRGRRHAEGFRIPRRQPLVAFDATSRTTTAAPAEPHVSRRGRRRRRGGGGSRRALRDVGRGGPPPERAASADDRLSSTSRRRVGFDLSSMPRRAAHHRVAQDRLAELSRTARVAAAPGDGETAARRRRRRRRAARPASG